MYPLVEFISTKPWSRYRTLLYKFGRYDVSGIVAMCPQLAMFSARDIALAYVVETVAFVYQTYVTKASSLRKRGLVLAVDFHVHEWIAAGFAEVPPLHMCKCDWIFRIGGRVLYMPENPCYYFGKDMWTFLESNYARTERCVIQYEESRKNNFDGEKMMTIWADECPQCKEPMEWDSDREVCAACTFDNRFNSACESVVGLSDLSDSVFDIAFSKVELEKLGFVF